MQEKFPFLGNLHPLSLSQQSASVEASVIDFGTSRVDKSIVTSRVVGGRLRDREACYCRGAGVVT